MLDNIQRRLAKEGRLDTVLAPKLVGWKYFKLLEILAVNCDDLSLLHDFTQALFDSQKHQTDMQREKARTAKERFKEIVKQLGELSHELPGH